jgi:hypothetical protein
MATGVAQPTWESTPRNHRAPATHSSVAGGGSLVSSADQDRWRKLEQTTDVTRATGAGQRLTKWRHRLGAAELGGTIAFLDGWSRSVVVDGQGELQ